MVWCSDLGDLCVFSYLWLFWTLLGSRLDDSLLFKYFLELQLMDYFWVLMSTLGCLEVPGLHIGLCLEIVVPCTCVIDVCYLWQVFKPFTCHLENRHHDGKVIGSSEVLPLVIPEISHVDPPIQIDIESPEMGSRENAEPPI